MKKLMMIVLLGCFFISGCGRAELARQASAAVQDVEITMWLIGSEAQALTIKELAKRFYDETRIKVKCDAISWGDAHSKYLTSIAGGVAPDIGTMGLTWGTEFGILGTMVDLGKAYPDEVSVMKESIFAGLWNSIEYKGMVFGIPFDMTEYVLYYRTDMVNKPPENWGEL